MASALFLNGVLLVLGYGIAKTAAETCSFYDISSWRYTYKTCYTSCCTYDCCISSRSSWSSWSSYTEVTTTAVKGWVIGVIVGGSVFGLIIFVAIIVCIVKAVNGSSSTRGTVVRPFNQPTVAVVSTQSGASAASNWAQPAYGPQGGVYPNQATYGPPPPGGPVPPPYTYNNPAFPPTQAPGPSQPSNDPFNEAAYGHKS